MRLSRQMIFWAATLIAVLAALWLVRDILLPFAAGMALAYLLDPLANRMERMGVSRLWATLAILAAFILLFLLLIVSIGPVLASNVAAFLERLPSYAARLQHILTDPSRPWLSKLVEGFPDSEAAIGKFVQQGVGWLAAFVGSLWSGGQALLSLLSLLVVTPVVAFYLIYDWSRIVAALDRWTPLPYRATVRELGRQMDEAIAGFVRGQTSVCLILGAFYAIALSLAGLHFSILIGIVSGLLSFIPYVGSLTGLLLAGAVALAQFFPNWTSIAIVIGIFLVGQAFEGNVLSPRLVGKSVGLHPVWLMFAMFAFGSLFGFVGLLLAVPLAAVIGVLARFALRQYLASPFYTGGEEGQGEEPNSRIENG